VAREARRLTEPPGRLLVGQPVLVEAFPCLAANELETESVCGSFEAAEPVAVDVPADPWPRAPEPWIPPS
jgi:hypothetical protein